jgi:DNA (cytosine-5)-methyltransferase 1
MTLWFCQRDHRTGIIKRRNLDEEPSFAVWATVPGMGDSLAGRYWLEDDAALLVLKQVNETSVAHYAFDDPSPAIMAKGIGGVWHSQYYIENDVRLFVENVNSSEQRGLKLDVVHTFSDVTDQPSPAIIAGRVMDYHVDPGGPKLRPPVADKPVYRVPTMAEIRATPWNGLKVVSTFAGCGGSSTGYRMAGFKVVWANEFVPAARNSYAANMDPETILDDHDIRGVQASDILAATGLVEGELDLLDGSPPCQAFSTAGKRSKGWGKDKTYEHGASQKNEELFTEFIRLLRGLKPKTFVAENVSGLVKGVAKGFFLDILKELKACGYRVECRMLDAQWLGVPQTRQRLIFIGVRNDLGLKPAFPKPLRYRYSIRDALPWIGSVEHDTSNTSGNFSAGVVTDRPSPAITVGVNSINSAHFKVDALVVGDPNIPQKPGNSFPRGDRKSLDEPCPTVGVTGQSLGGALRYHLEGRVVQGPHVDFRNAGRTIPLDGPAPAVAAGDASRRTPDQFLVETRVIHDTGNWNHEVTDKPCPAVTVGHANYTHFQVEERVVHDTGGFVREHDVTDEPCPTITAGPKAAAGGGPRNHFHVEAAPTERRKFTIAELRRICAFPDDFVLTGSYAQQWERLGNSVPPVMMRAIAETVKDRILKPP